MSATACEHCPLRGMPLFVPFNAEELAFMRRFKTGELRVERNVPILHEGHRSSTLYTVLSGIGTRSVVLADGRRQVINFVFPGYMRR